MITPESEEDFGPGHCNHGILGAQCTMCNGREQQEQANRWEVVYVMLARYFGHCAKCRTEIEPGDELSVTRSGEYICGTCSPRVPA